MSLGAVSVSELVLNRAAANEGVLAAEPYEYRQLTRASPSLTPDKSNSACWNGLHPVFPSKLLTKVSGFLNNQAYFITLITLNSQSTSNKSNSACWNGLHPVFPSNLLTKVSGFLNNQADFINMQSAICPDDTLKV